MIDRAHRASMRTPTAATDASRMTPVRLLLPDGVDASAAPLLVGRALRAFADGYMAVLLPAYLLAIGLGTLDVGIVATATMLGSALATIAVGAWGHRFRSSALLRGAALLMALTGVAFAGLSSFWPLLAVAFVGTLNPSSGDVSVFLPLEHARLAACARGHARTALFARYSVLGAVCAAFGALAAALPGWLVGHGVASLTALRAMFVPLRGDRSASSGGSTAGLRIRQRASPRRRRRRRSTRREASSSASPPSSASTRSPAGWSSIRSSRSGSCSASGCRSRRRARSSSGPGC